MRTLLATRLSLLLAAACLFAANIPVAAQHGRTEKPSTRRVQPEVEPDGDEVKVEDGQIFVARPWEAVSPVPDFNNLLAPQITPVSGAWTFIGPAPLNAGGSNGKVSGRITGIAAHPTDPNTIYITAAGGGVWKTTNGGTNWTPITDTQKTLSMGCIGLAPTNPNHIYAGTGEANNSGDSNFGRGILSSTDGGASWTLAFGPNSVFNTFRLTCSKLAVDPTNENIAYAAMSPLGHNGIFATNTSGVYKTVDGGATWTNVTAANGKEATYPWSDVVIDPSVPTTVYAAVGYHGGNAANAIYKSTDSGATWTQLTATNAPLGTTFGRTSLAVSKLNSPGILYAASTNPSTSGLNQMVRSDDGGTTFTLLSPPNYMSAQGWYDTWLAADQTNSANAFAAGSAGTNSMLKTTTSGAAWTAFNIGILNNGVVTSPHVDHHATAFDANGRLLDGNDGGIYRLDDPAGPIWTNINGDLGTIQFEGIGMHPTNSQIAIGGSQDNGTELYSGTTLWTETDGGDGGWAKFNPTNGNVVYHQIPVQSAGSNFFRVSTNGGSNWVTRTTGIIADQANQNFYAPFVVDPNNGDRVLYGTKNIWETTDQGVTWTSLSTVGTGNWNPSGLNVRAIGLAPSSVNTIYAAISGSIFVTTDHGATWTARSQPVSGTIQDIQVDPTTPTTAYVVLASFTSAGNVYKTTDAGATWTNISGNLQAVTACGCPIPVWSLQLDPANGKIYVGADDGVYVTANGGATWSRFGTGLPNGQVYQIELNKNLGLLGAAIHGRGMWEILTATVPGSNLIAFQANNYNADEGGGHIDVTVARTGDTSGSASVNYTTSDLTAGIGHASQTSDYQMAVGTVSFAPGETAKTFRVLIVDDKFVEGNETLGLTLSNPTGVNTSLGSPTSATITILDNDTVPATVNPYDGSGFFVRQHYLDFLNREPDQSGLDFWTNQITSCGSDAACVEVRRINVSAAFYLSKEFQNTGYLAYRTYRSAFGPTAPNSPVPIPYTNFIHDVQELGNGYVDLQPGADQVLENNKVAYFNEFVNRPEFLVKYPLNLSNQSFVDGVLGTASLPTTGAFRDSLLNGLNGGTMTRATVLRSIAESATIQSREFNNAFVAMQYFGYLRRDPDAGGYQFWLDKLNAFHGDYIAAEMVKAFITSIEARQRFGTP